jgi:hypothetical protein
LVYDQSFPAFQIGSYDRTIGAGSPGYVESGSGWKAWPSGGARYHAKGTGKNTATWTFTDMAASPSAFYDVWVSWPAKSNNASNAKFSVVSGNGTTVYTVNQQVSLPPGGYYLGTFPFPSLGSADGKGQITVVLSDNANGNVVAATVGAMISHPGSPLRAMAPPPGAGAGGILSPAALPALEQEALARWAATGLTSVQLHQLQNLSFQIADLGGTTLGLAVGSTIMVDDNAAGWGWFVDPTPGNDSEFTTPGNQGEQNRMDLLTVLMHEMGHVLGQNHESTGLMAESLAEGERLSPRVVDHCFADKVDWSDLAVALAQEEHPNHRS